MSALPTQYAWLNGTVGLPKMVVEGLKTFGTVETPGAGNSPVIMGWADEVDLERVYTADAIAWCGLWMAMIAQRAGKSFPKNPLWALNWKSFGIEGGQPDLGDVLVFVRDGGGHVGLYIGEDRGNAMHPAAYHVLGGNTSDKVTIARIDKKRLVAVRQPAYLIGRPAAAKPHILGVEGLLSTNEA
jgi:uncharacterized protein (TIGR02594 family)